MGRYGCFSHKFHAAFWQKFAFLAPGRRVASRHTVTHAHTGETHTDTCMSAQTHVNVLPTRTHTRTRSSHAHARTQRVGLYHFLVTAFGVQRPSGTETYNFSQLHSFFLPAIYRNFLCKYFSLLQNMFLSRKKGFKYFL